MMDFPALFEPWTAIFTLVCSVTVFVILQIILKINYPGDQVTKRYESCKSPDCVRCAKFHDLLPISYRRFHDCMQNVIFGVGVNGNEDMLEDPCNVDYRRIKVSFKSAQSPFTSNSSASVKSDTCKILSGFSGSLMNNQQPTVFKLLNLPSQPWWNKVYENDLNKLKSNFHIIKEEFRTVYRFHDEGKFWNTNSTPSGRWSIFSFVNQGCVCEDNVGLCPRTWSAIRSLESFMMGSVFGNAVFSVIFPDTLITEHFGPTNIRLRCHLGLDVPAGCSLTVAGSSRNWIEGDCLVFDDSFLHAALYTPGKDDHDFLNASIGSVSKNKQLIPRTVLMLDLWHPNITARERDMLSYVFSSESL